MKFVCTTARFVNRTALSVLMLAAVLPLSATECVWTGSSGNWGDESCWSGRVKPSAAGDTVTINGENVTVTVGETDIASFGFVTNITVASATSRIVVDTASDVTSPAEFRGKGKLVKTGTSKLSLSYAGIKANGYAAIGLFGELIISNGVVQLPNRTASDGLTDGIYLPKTSIWAPGILSLGNSPGTYCNYGIWGDGTITNGYSGCQLCLSCFNCANGIPVFSGKFTPRVQVTVIHDNTWGTATQYLTGEGSSCDITLRMDGIVGTTKIGNKGETSPLGTNNVVSFRTKASRLIYLGDSGETINKNMQFLNNCACGTLDAGAHGGLTFGTEWYISAYTGWSPNYRCNTICLTGSNTVPCVIAGGMYDMADRAATYWRKEGTGTWRFNNNRDFMGTIDVRCGTLQFDSLAEKGERCSLGYATMTFEDVSDLPSSDRALSAMESHKVPYAMRMGSENAGVSDEHIATLEYVGASAATCLSRPIAVIGAGRLLTTGGSLNLAGATALGTAEGTLVLDGGGTNVFTSVTNGLGTLNVVKRGIGTWRLRDDVDIESAVAEGGVLEIGSRYTFYRWTITANNGGAGDAWIASFNGFALMDQEGNIVNGTLGSKGMAAKNGQPWLLEPGEICYQTYRSSTGDRYPSNSFWWLADQEQFKGGPAAIDVTVQTNNPSTFPILYFRPDPDVNVYKYDILSDVTASREVAYWELAGSEDGRNWTPLHTIDATTGTPAPFTSARWYSTGTTTRGGYEIATGKSDPRISIGFIGVRSGGVIKFIGSSRGKEVASLVVDAQNPSGVIDGAAFANDGTIDIANWSEDKHGLKLPLDLSGCTGYANIADWRIISNGKTMKKRLVVNADGITVFRRGMIMSFH